MSLPFVKVVGKLAITAGDQDDLDDEPEVIYCSSGKVNFRPLISEMRVIPDEPIKPFTAGNRTISCDVDLDGNITYRGKPFVNLFDLTSTQFNPRIPEGAAQYEVTFESVRADGELVEFSPYNIAPVAGVENDLTLLAPVGEVDGQVMVRGPGQRYTGPWVSGGDYSVDDLATYDGSVWIRTVAGGGITTPDLDDVNWDLYVSKGADGSGGTGGGTGDVVGPASSTDQNLAMFSGVNGKTLADSGISIPSLVLTTSLGAPSGVATLDTGGKLPVGQLPAITKAMVGLGSVDNTADIDKPVSNAQQLAINTAINNLINSAPGTLDTLGEIATQLQNDQSGIAAINSTLALKAPLDSPTFTGTVGGITKAMVGLGSVDNTADVNKPVSTPQQTALNGKLSLKNNALVDLSVPLTDTVGTFQITGDGSATTNWVNRLVFQFQGTGGAVLTKTSYFNEYGELRIAPAKNNTVPLRVFSRETTSNPAHDAATPLIEVMDDRFTRTQKFAVWNDGSITSPSIEEKVVCVPSGSTGFDTQPDGTLWVEYTP